MNKKKQKIQTKTNNQLKAINPPHVLNQETGICSSNLFNLNSLINPFNLNFAKERRKESNQASKQATTTTTTLLVGSSRGRSFCQSLFSQHSFITLFVVVVVFIASYFEISMSPETHRLIVSHILCVFLNFRSSGIPRFSQGREGAWVVNELSMSLCVSFLQNLECVVDLSEAL